MKLMFIVHSLGGGGAERVVSMLVNELSSRHEVSIVTFEELREYPVPSSVDVVSLGFASYEEGVHGWLRHGSAAAVRLARIVQRTRPDLCISFMTMPNLFNVAASKLHRRPTLLSVRNTLSRGIPDSNRGGRTLRMGVRRMFAGRHIVAISHGVGRDLVENFGHDSRFIHTIHNPIDIDRVVEASNRPLPAELAPIFEYPVAITVGRIVPQKCHWSLVRAFSKTRERIADAKLVIVGRGGLDTFVKQSAEAQDLRVWTPELGEPASGEWDVFLTGRVLDPFHLVRASRVFVFSSSHEGLGNVLLESLAVGTPIVSSDCEHGPREIIAPELAGRAVTARHDGPFGVLLPTFPSERAAPEAGLTTLETRWGEDLADIMLDSRLLASLSEVGPLRANDFRVSKIATQWEALITELFG